MIIFKHIKVLLGESDHLDTRILVRGELKNNVLPDIFKSIESILRFLLFFSLICDFFNILLVLTKIEIVNVLQKEGVINKSDNLDIWTSLAQQIAERAKNCTIKVTWTRGHATDEHIAAGQSTEVERRRNAAVDELATQGINLLNMTELNKMDAPSHLRLTQ